MGVNFTTRSKLSAKGREKFYVCLNLNGHKTERFGGYREEDADKLGHELITEYHKDPEAFFNRSKLKGTGIRPIMEEFLTRSVEEDTNDINRSHLEAIVDGYELTGLEKINKYLIWRIKADMKKSGAANGYISMRLRIFRAFIRFCIDKKYLKDDPWPTATDQRATGGGPLIPTYRSKGYFYPDAELLRMTDLPLSAKEHEIDLVRAIKLALYQGWRLESVWGFHPDRLDLEHGTYTLPARKGAAEREVPLIQPTLDLLKDWPAPLRGPFFTRWSTPTVLGNTFHKWRVERCKINKGRFHDLKHTCISKLFLAGYTPAQVEAFTNTSRAALVYYTHVNKKELEEKLSVYNPLPKIETTV